MDALLYITFISKSKSLFSCLVQILLRTIVQSPIINKIVFKAIPHNSRLTAQAPLRRLRHGICVAKMLDNVGLRYPHRASGAKAPRTLRPLPLLRFAVSATGGAHLCSIQYYLRFWLSIYRTSLAVSALRIMRYCFKIMLRRERACLQKLKKIFSRQNGLVLLLVLVEFMVLALRFVGDFHTGGVIDITPDLIIPYAEECTNDDRGARVENFTGLFATTRWIDLPRGSYQVCINYVNDGEDGEVSFLDEIMPTAQYDAAKLPAERTRTVFSLWMPYGCETAQLQFTADCGKNQVIYITGAQIVPTHAWAYVRLLTGLVFCAVLDWVILLLTRRVKFPIHTLRGRYIAMALVGIGVFACLPLGLGYLTYGHDLSIHLSRIEGLKAGLLAGQFPVRMDPAIINEKGYPFSLMYSDVFLYPAAVLRILGFSLQTSYKVYVASITAATVGITFYALRKMFRSDCAALLGTALYTLSFYRLTNVFVRAAVGEYTAMAFLPLVVYGLWWIYRQSPADGKKAEPWCWLPFALGFTGLLQSHLLTTELAVFFTAAFCLLYFKKTFTRPVLPALCKAAGAAIVWNLWFMVPLLQYMVQGVCRISGKYDAAYLYDSSVYLGQMFLMFGQSSGVAESIQSGIAGEMPQTLGLALAAGAFFFLLAVLDSAVRKSSRGAARIGSLTLGFGLLAAWCASDLCPWYALFRCEPLQALSKTLGKLQFAWRFFTPATMLLVVCACCAVVLYRKVRPEAAKAMAAALLALTIIPAGYLMYDKCTTSEAVTYMSLAAVDDLPGQVGGGEYLPTEDTTTDDSVWGRLTPEADDGVELTEYTKNGLTIQLAAQNTGDTEASIRLPLFYYPGYHMTAADGAALTHKNGYLTVTLAPGWQGSVQVRWTGMWFWRAADCISLLGIATTVVLYRKSQKNAARA